MAAIPNVKVTMDFVYGSIGWSESHIYSTSPITVDNAQLYKDAKNLVAARSQCLSGHVKFLQCKFSQEQINRDVAYLKTADLPAPATNGYSGGPQDLAFSTVWAFQTPHVSWPMKLNDNFQNQLAIVYLAGMPASSGQTGPGPYDCTTVTPGFFLQKYGDYLITGSPWGVASRTWPVGPFTLDTSTPMTAPPTTNPATATAPTTINFTMPATVGGVNIVPGTWIRVGGLKYTTAQNRLRLNGTYQVFQYTGGVATCFVPRLRSGPVFGTNPGYVQAARYAFEGYSAYTLDNITHRKRGRAALQARGRQSSR